MTQYRDFSNIPLSAFGCLMIDPPWRFEARTEAGYERSPQAHYNCVSTADLARLDIRSIAAPSSVVWLWSIAPMLDQAVGLLRAWGFEFVTAGAWGKRSKSGAAWQFGTGYYMRSAAEFFLIGKIGRPAIRARNVRNLIAPDDLAELVDGDFLVEPVREHSRKPEAGYRAAERLFDGPHIELFSRVSRPGWSAFGDEVGKLDGQGGRA